MPTVTDKSVQGIIDVLGGMSDGGDGPGSLALKNVYFPGHPVSVNAGDMMIVFDKPGAIVITISRVLSSGIWEHDYAGTTCTIEELGRIEFYAAGATGQNSPFALIFKVVT